METDPWQVPEHRVEPVASSRYTRAPHTEPMPYVRLLRTRRYRWWRPLVGLLLAALALVVIALGLYLAGEVLSLVATGHPLRESELEDFSSPAGLLLGNLTLAAFIPAIWFAVLVCHGERVGWVSSVAGRLRWGLLVRAALLALAVTVLSYVAYRLLPGGGGEEPSGTGWPGWASFAPLALVILATTPLQAAGEEYAFRGYFSQALGSWIRWPWVPALISAGLFALAHGYQEPLLFVDRFAFALLASFLVFRTGGLEAGIALHAVNNVVSLLDAAAAGDLTGLFEQTSIPWWALAVDLLLYGVFAWLVVRLARRRQVEVVSARPF